MTRFLPLLLLILSLSVKSQTKISQTEKFKQIGLVWGLLKYHHPDISKGIYDWDIELINLIEKVKYIDEQENLNTLLLKFVDKFNNPINQYTSKPIKVEDKNIFKKNYSYNWIDKTDFSPKLKDIFISLKNNNNIGDHYATVPKISKIVSFNNEKELLGFDPILKSHRLLTLFRFWNIIQYWNVNKYLTDTNWITVLEELIPVFLNAKSIENYEIAKLKMLSTLNDSHSYQTSSFIYSTLFKYKPPFEVNCINDTLLVTAIYNKTLAQKNEIYLGDVIVKINNLQINDYIDSKFASLLSHSNKTYLRELTNRFILKNKSDSLQIQILSKQVELKNKTIKLNETFKIENFKRLVKREKGNWRKITPKITYINLGNITSKELFKIFKENKDDKGIILDLRNYPKRIDLGDLSKILFPESKEFVKVLMPLKDHPSIGEYNAEASLKLIHQPFKVGRKNSDYFKGKIILLVNRQTGSMTEYLGMAIQQSPNCYTIGEQTMGAVMNITSAFLPDKQEFYFTSMGAFYPNGEVVQRKGLRIDLYINESATNYSPNLYIEKAVELIEKH